MPPSFRIYLFAPLQCIHRAGCLTVNAGVFREYLGRSVVKAISYRVIVVVADFVAVYFFTGRIEIALGFVIVSNIYTTGLYFLHERFWDRVAWGKGMN
jgi:uncharacterized membrane protein